MTEPGNGGALADTTAVVPRLRGALHAGTFPCVIVAGFALVALARSEQARLAAAVYGLTSALLFGVSALYHRWRTPGWARDLLHRLDHANIFLIIAGTYTPLSVLALRGDERLAVLAGIWTGAALGIAFRVTWMRAPRWLYTALYIALGWVAVFILPQLLHGAGLPAFVLIVTGGILYSVGGLVYALRRPDPSPRWFGFHEVFHAFTIAAYVAQYAAVSVVVYRAA